MVRITTPVKKGAASSARAVSRVLKCTTGTKLAITSGSTMDQRPISSISWNRRVLRTSLRREWARTE